MIKRKLFLKACALFARQDVELHLITSDKIVGDVHESSAKDIIPIAIKYDYVITFRQSAKPKRFDFEIFLDLPF